MQAMQTSHRFSPLDEIMPPLYYSFIYCFPCKNHLKGRTYSVLKDGLTRMVREKPFLAAEIIRETSDHPANGKRPGSLSLKIPDEFVAPELVLNDLTRPESGWKYSYEDLKKEGMPMSKLDGEVLAPVQYGMYSKKNKAFEFQVNFIPGGCLLVASSIHTFVDAWGFTVVMYEWARYCREVQSAGSAAKNGHLADSAAPYDGMTPALEVEGSMKDYERLKNRPELWKYLGLDWRKDGFQPAPYAQPPVVNTSLFRFTKGSLEAILKEATPRKNGSTNSDGDSVSLNDALVAFIWRSCIRARYPPGSKHNETSMISVAIDGRTRLSPTIPHSHVANVVFCGLTELPLQYVADKNTPLSEIAQAIRKCSNENASSEVLTAAVKLAASIPDVRQLGNAFRTWFDEDIVTTNGMAFPIYDADFGRLIGNNGHPEFFRMPKAQFDGITSIQPRQRNGDVEVLISLSEDQMSRLREDPVFCKHMDFICQ